MTNYIEELYYGNIDPQNSRLEDDAGVQRELQTISENEDWLTEHLTDEKKKRFLDFADAWSAGGSDATLDGFITGFLLGACFVMDNIPSRRPPENRFEIEQKEGVICIITPSLFRHFIALLCLLMRSNTNFFRSLSTI